MWDLARRLAWFAIVASAFSYAALLVLGSIVNAQASGLRDPVVIRDDLGVGIHRLSGMVMVPSRCDQVSLRTEALSTSTYSLAFTTWRDPSVACGGGAVPRAFRQVVFAPSAGVHFLASLDGRSFPIVVIPILRGRE